MFIHPVSQQSSDWLYSLVMDLETELNVTITLHDRLGLFRNFTGQTMFSYTGFHPHPYCRLKRLDGSGYDRACLAHCRDHVDAVCQESPRPHVGLCWKGVQEIIVPISQNGSVAFILFLGGFRHYQGQGQPRSDQFPPAIINAWNDLTLLRPDRVNGLARLATALGQGILKRVDEIRQIDTSDSDRATQIRRFIHARAHEPVRLRDLAATLHLSPSRTRHVVAEQFNRSFRELLKYERVERAAFLLRYSRYTLQEIAQQCGFGTAYYFNRVFKQRKGTPPGAYRRAVS